jgi:hypothetical protein
MGTSGIRAYSGEAALRQAASSLPKPQFRNWDRNAGPPLSLLFLKLFMGPAMPRYFFHVRDGDSFSPDIEGQELPDLEAARREGISANREILGERLLHGGSLDSRQLQIADESGAVLITLKTDDILRKDGQYRSFDDDVTKSAPVITPISPKPAVE